MMAIDSTAVPDSEIKTTKPKKSKAPKIAAAAVVLAALGFGAWYFFFRDTGVEEVSEKRGYVVHNENVHQVAESMMEQEPVRAGNYLTEMTTTWTFANSTAISEDAYVANDPMNTNDIYFDVEIEDTGEVIYESPVLPLGTFIDGIALDKELEAGTYPCVVVYHLIDADQNTVSTLRVRVTVIVEN